jgi:hypothetical protein
VVTLMKIIFLTWHVGGSLARPAAVRATTARHDRAPGAPASWRSFGG